MRVYLFMVHTVTQPYVGRNDTSLSSSIGDLTESQPYEPRQPLGVPYMVAAGSASSCPRSSS